MLLFGLILLLAATWYLVKITSKFLDEQTKKAISNSFNILKNKLNERKQNFTTSKLKKLGTNKRGWGSFICIEIKLMEYFIITLFTKDISQVDLIDLVVGNWIGNG